MWTLPEAPSGRRPSGSQLSTLTGHVPETQRFPLDVRRLWGGSTGGGRPSVFGGRGRMLSPGPFPRGMPSVARQAPPPPPRRRGRLPRNGSKGTGACASAAALPAAWREPLAESGGSASGAALLIERSSRCARQLAAWLPLSSRTSRASSSAQTSGCKQSRALRAACKPDPTGPRDGPPSGPRGLPT